MNPFWCVERHISKATGFQMIIGRVFHLVLGILVSACQKKALYDSITTVLWGPYERCVAILARVQEEKKKNDYMSTYLVGVSLREREKYVKNTE